MYYSGESNVPGAPGNNWVGSSMPVVNLGYGGQQGQVVAGNPSFNINESAGTRKIRSIRRLGESGVGGEKDAAVEMLKRLGGPQLPQVNVPGAPGNIGGFGGNVDYQIAQGKQEQNLINPLDWFSGRNQETINQVQEGKLQGTPSNSPTGQFIKGVNDRNNALNELMKQM